jgi:hypothetical protein
MKDLKGILEEYMREKSEIEILYDYERGILNINGKEYEVGRLSFSGVGGAVKSALREIYGKYKTTPYAFNSEVYENEKFSAGVLALGSAGLLRFTVTRKQI